MGYATIGEMVGAHQAFIDDMAIVPEDFDVHDDYLIDGMDRYGFIRGYRAYRELLATVQGAMCADPQGFGLVKKGPKGIEKPVNASNYALLWLFVAMAQAGTVANGVLRVDGERFLEYVNGKAIGSHSAVPRNIESMVERLGGFGVRVEGYSHGSGSGFTVSSDIPWLVAAMKASTLSQYCRKSLMSDYCAFNHRLFAFGADETIPIAFTHTFASMPEESRQILTALIEGLARHGWRIAKARHHSTTKGWLSFKPLEVYYGSDGGFWLMIEPWTVHEHHGYVEALPQRYRERWVSTTRACRGCRKGECRSRYVGEFLGRKGVHCNGDKTPYPLEMQDIPAIIETSLALAGKLPGA